MGLYEFNVLPFGLTGGPSSFQRIMDEVLRGLEKHKDNFIDDILVFSPDKVSHRNELRKIFNRLRKYNLTLRGRKCEVGRSKVTYLGHTFSIAGMEPQISKVESINGWIRPSCKKQVKQFLGLASYYRRYIRDFATIADPLNRLLNSEVAFVWGNQEEATFMNLKQLLTSSPVLQCPDFNKRFELYTDASGTGLGAVLEQNGHVIAYYSRTLRGAERNYSTIEQECLAIVESLKRFRHYLIGRQFAIFTDLKPLEWLHTQKAVGRLWRWGVLIQEYDFEIIHRRGKENINADALSRSHDDNKEESCSATKIILFPDLEEVRKQQLNDKIIGRVIFEMEAIPRKEQFIGGLWHSQDFKRFKQIQSQLLLHNGVLLRNYKVEPFSNLHCVIIVPDTMKEEFLEQAHDEAGHQGVERTLDRLKRMAYWVGMTTTVNEYVNSCDKCQKVKLSLPTQAPLLNTPCGRPLQMMQVDVLEVPLSLDGNKYLLVVEDTFSKWLEAYPMKNQKSETITNLLVQTFSRLGIPEYIHSDQGANFESALLKETCRALGIRKTRTSAYHPQGNSLVERSNRTILQMLRCYVEESWEWEKYLPLVLYAYRTTKHATTKVTPFQLMFGRDPLGNFHTEESITHDPTSYETFLCKKMATLRDFVEGHTIEAQSRQKEYYDGRSHFSKLSLFKKDDNVLLSIPHSGVARKLRDRWEGGWRVIEVKGPLSIEIQNTDGRNKLVHINRLRPYVQRGRPIDSNIQPIEYEITPPLFHSTLEGTRWNNLSETTNTPNEENHDLFDRLSTLPDTSNFNRSSNNSKVANMDSSIYVDQENSLNLSMNLNGDALNVSNPIITSTPTKNTGRPQRTRKLPTKFGDYVLY